MHSQRRCTVMRSKHVSIYEKDRVIQLEMFSREKVRIVMRHVRKP